MSNAWTESPSRQMYADFVQLYRYGGTQKGNIVKECLETAWNHGISEFRSAVVAN